MPSHKSAWAPDARSAGDPVARRLHHAGGNGGVGRKKNAVSLVDGRTDLPSLGVSMPAPRGWFHQPDRIGSIGMILIDRWLQPAEGKPRKALAIITLVAMNPETRSEFDAKFIIQEGPKIGGRPSAYLRRKPGVEKLPMWDNEFFEAYRVEHQGMDFYLLHSAADPRQTSKTFRAVAEGISWSDPVPAHRALAMTRRLESLAEGLSFENPDPFWANGFRGRYYETFSLAPHDEFEGTFEIHEIKDAKETQAALHEAAQMESYYGTRITSAVWRKVSDLPEVHVTEMSAAAPPLGEMPLHTKLIVARCADGTYVRIGFFFTGPAQVAERYDKLMNAVARSISTTTPPEVPELIR